MLQAPAAVQLIGTEGESDEFIIGGQGSADSEALMPLFLKIKSERACQHAHLSICILLLLWPSLPTLSIGIEDLSFVGIGVLTSLLCCR